MGVLIPHLIFFEIFFRLRLVVEAEKVAQLLNFSLFRKIIAEIFGDKLLNSYLCIVNKTKRSLIYFNES